MAGGIAISSLAETVGVLLVTFGIVTGGKGEIEYLIFIT